LKRWLALAAALLLPACGSHQLDLEALSSASDQIVWEAGQKAVEKKDWASARQYFRRLIDAFPQSEHQPDSRIALADSYFEEGGTANYVLAVSSYREFLTLYPQHPRSDYAQFRAGESYFKQKNTPDRDQTATQQALEEYQRLLDVYPQSSWVEPARERVHECRQSLARAHFSVGYFYQKTRQAWRSAIGRYETIVTDYPDFEKIDEVLYRLGECLGNAGRYAEARPHLARLQAEFPESPFVELAKKLEATFPPPGVAPAETPPAGPKVTPKETPAPAAPNAPPPSSERPQVSL
jgi:outer membrane protein assembly factor BamD